MPTSNGTRRRRSVTVDGALFFSRLDYPSDDTRVGLWLQGAAQAAREEHLGIAVIAGGLVSHKAIVARQKVAAETAGQVHDDNVAVWVEEKEAIKADNVGLRKAEQTPLPSRKDHGLPTKPEAKAVAKLVVLDEIVKELSELLPVIVDASGKVVKTYIITTPAVAYDGPHGGYVADELSKVRKDLVAWSDTGDARLPLKGMYLSDDPDSPLYLEEHVLALLLPDRALWASVNASTGIQKIIREKAMQSSLKPPSLYMVGCVGTYVQRPVGAGRTVGALGLPALHKISRIRGSENQIAYTIVRFTNSAEDGFRYFPRVYSVKDQIQDERDYISIPEDANEYQKAILRELQNHPRTIGQLEDSLPWERSTIQRALDQYNDNPALQPRIVKSGSLYDIDSSYLMLRLRYPLPNPDDVMVDNIIAWSCQHAGSTNTQYDWFNNKLPELILEHGITCAFNAGDQQEGMKHDLERNGELIGGVNYSVQQILAGVMPGNVILQVFEARLKEKLGDVSAARRKKLSKKQILEIVDDVLMWYYHISGNHDQWVLGDGHTPLALTHYALRMFIYWGCRQVLAQYGLELENLLEVVSEHITYGNESELPSSLSSHTRHPHMGRSQTWSAKAEESMHFSRALITITGNYHDSASVLLWNQIIGQTIGVSLGTIKDRSLFEENKNKHVDNNVWLAGIHSIGGRILSTEDIFVGPSEGATKTYSKMGGIPTVLMDAMVNIFPHYDPVWEIVDRPEVAA